MNPYIADLAEEKAHTLHIVLPWPDPRLWPNFKRGKHWSHYRAAEKQARQDGANLVYEALGHTLSAVRASFAGKGPIPFRIRFRPPDSRYRDDDGMLGAIKHHRDGIADALKVNDRRFASSFSVGAPEKPGQVEITIG